MLQFLFLLRLRIAVAIGPDLWRVLAMVRHDLKHDAPTSPVANLPTSAIDAVEHLHQTDVVSLDGSREH
jgi:hypothetical protein